MKAAWFGWLTISRHLCTIARMNIFTNTINPDVNARRMNLVVVNLVDLLVVYTGAGAD